MNNQETKKNKQCPAIIVKDFHYTNNYSLIIKCSPNAFQLLTDKPFLYNDSNLMPQIKINNKDAVENINDINLKKTIDKYNKIIKNIKLNIDDKLKPIFDMINNPTKQTTDCSEDIKNSKNNADDSEKENIINIKNSDDKIVDIINLSQINEKIVQCEVDNSVKLVELFTLPENFDPLEYQTKSPEVKICNLPESKLKNQVDYIINKLPDDLNDKIKKINTESNPLDNQGIEFNDKNIKIESEDDLKYFYKNFNNDDVLKKITDRKTYLGIPLAVLEKNTPVIIQIINKKLQVMNLFNGLSDKQLEIDKEINIYKPFTVIFKTNGFLHQLYLMIDDDPQVYKSEVFVPKNLSIHYFGIDPKVQKSYCGLILDIQILTYQKNPDKTYIENNIKFKTPNGCLAFYDWHKDRIKYNLVYPLPDLKYPVKMYGNFLSHYTLDKTKNPYHFMSKSYLSEFFCSRLLNQDEWSLWFWFYIDPKLTSNNSSINDFRTIVYDHKNNNELSFDFNSMLFNFNFNNHEIKKQYIIDTNIWYQNILKYNKKDSKLVFKIRRIDIKDLSATTEFIINTSNLKFDLFSMLAKFDDWSYKSYFPCKFGTMSIFNNYTTSGEENDHFLSSKKVIKKLNL